MTVTSSEETCSSTPLLGRTVLVLAEIHSPPTHAPLPKSTVTTHGILRGYGTPFANLDYLGRIDPTSVIPKTSEVQDLAGARKMGREDFESCIKTLFTLMSFSEWANATHVFDDSRMSFWTSTGYLGLRSGSLELEMAFGFLPALEPLSFFAAEVQNGKSRSSSKVRPTCMA